MEGCRKSLPTRPNSGFFPVAVVKSSQPLQPNPHQEDQSSVATGGVSVEAALEVACEGRAADEASISPERLESPSRSPAGPKKISRFSNRLSGSRSRIRMRRL